MPDSTHFHDIDRTGYLDLEITDPIGLGPDYRVQGMRADGTSWQGQPHQSLAQAEHEQEVMALSGDHFVSLSVMRIERVTKVYRLDDRVTADDADSVSVAGSLG